jgi:hypothetical protein
MRKPQLDNMCGLQLLREQYCVSTKSRCLAVGTALIVIKRSNKRWHKKGIWSISNKSFKIFPENRVK